MASVKNLGQRSTWTLVFQAYYSYSYSENGLHVIQCRSRETIQILSWWSRWELFRAGRYWWWWLEEWDSEYILEVDLAVFADKLGVKCERMIGVKGDYKVLILNNSDYIDIYWDVKHVGDTSLKLEKMSLGMDMSNIRCLLEIQMNRVSKQKDFQRKIEIDRW